MIPLLLSVFSASTCSWCLGFLCILWFFFSFFFPMSSYSLGNSLGISFRFGLNNSFSLLFLGSLGELPIQNYFKLNSRPEVFQTSKVIRIWTTNICEDQLFHMNYVGGFLWTFLLSMPRFKKRSFLAILFENKFSSSLPFSGHFVSYPLCLLRWRISNPKIMGAQQMLPGVC